MMIREASKIQTQKPMNRTPHAVMLPMPEIYSYLLSEPIKRNKSSGSKRKKGLNMPSTGSTN
ncbi:hypothetical protein FRX31_025237 [Thalictrum thalictroides]|uniref:Uncharacterized protein n=1 Tax=Thalictrum thalictroides TaxID=46969 RepID=A0A7J6VLG7_THATH|nr:hypothetical protein FRX31_025237 [Thalictrum thalictroides]